MPRAARALWVAATLTVATAGCQIDDVMHAVPWFGSMIRQPAIKPYAMTRPMPEGIVPVTGGEPEWAEPTPDGRWIWVTGDLRPVNAMQNPQPRTAESLLRGRQLYDIYCTVCHGATGGPEGGLGDGPFTQVYPAVLGLNTDQARAYSDGYLYSIIRYGRGVMPRYGDKIYSISDRWDLVNYVRQLQAGGSAR